METDCQSFSRTRNLSSHIDMHADAGSRIHNLVILTFDLLTLRSVLDELLPLGMCVPSLVLIA